MVGRMFSGVGTGTNLSIIVSALPNVGPGLGASSAEITAFARKVEMEQRNMNRALRTSRGNWAYWAAGIATAAAIAESHLVGVANTIESEWADVTTLLPRASAVMTDKMRDDLLEYATFVGTDWIDAIRAEYQTVSAVFTDPADQRRMIVAAENLSRAIRVPLAEATRLIIAGANAFDETSEEFARIADLYTIGIRYGVTTGEEMVQSLGKVLPVAKALGFGLEEVVAAHAALTNAGLESAEAAVNQRQMYTQLLQVAQDVGKQFETFYGQTPKQFVEAGNDYIQFMEAVMDVSERSGHTMYELFGRVQSANAAQILTGTRGIEILKLALDDAEGAAVEAAQRVRETTAYELGLIDAEYRKTFANWGAGLQDFHVNFRQGVLDVTDAIGITDSDETKARGALLRFNAILDDTAGVGTGVEDVLADITTQVNELVVATGNYKTSYLGDIDGLIDAALTAGFEQVDRDHETEAYSLWRMWTRLTPSVRADMSANIEQGQSELFKDIRRWFERQEHWGHWDDLNAVGQFGAGAVEIGDRFHEYMNEHGDFTKVQTNDMLGWAQAMHQAGIDVKYLDDAFDGMYQSATVFEEMFEDNARSIEGYALELIRASDVIEGQYGDAIDSIVQSYNDKELGLSSAKEALDEINAAIQAEIAANIAYREGVEEATEAVEQFSIAHMYLGQEMQTFDLQTLNLEKVMRDSRAIYNKQLELGVITKQELVEKLQNQLETSQALEVNYSTILDLHLRIKQLTEEIAAETSAWAWQTQTYVDRLVSQLSGMGGLAGGELGDVRGTMDYIAESWWRRHNDDLAEAARSQFDFDAAWIEAQWNHRFGMFENLWDREKEFEDWRKRELEAAGEMYSYIAEQVDKAEAGSREQLNWMVKQVEQGRYLQEIWEAVNESFDFASAFEDEQFQRSTGIYQNPFDQANYLEFGGYLSTRDANLRRRLDEIRGREAGLTGQELFSNQSEQRRLMDQIAQLGNLAPPDKRTALSPQQREAWEIEDLKYALEEIGSGDYLGMLRTRQDFWRAVGLETEVLRIEQQIRSIEEQTASQYRDIAQPIVKAIEEQTDVIKDRFGREVEVAGKLDPRGRAVAGMGLEFAATRNRSRIPITTRR